MLRTARSIKRVLLGPFVDPEPAARIIRTTARHQWRLISVNLATSLFEAFSEGATFGVIFLAVQMLSAPAAAGQSTGINWETNPIVGHFPGVVDWMETVDPIHLFLALLALAVLLQASQSLSRYLSQLSVGYFAARCRAIITARVHSQILSLSYACASQWRVGDLVDQAAQGPMAVQVQIEAASQLLITGLLIAVYVAVLVGISPWMLLVAVLLGVLITFVQRKLLPRIRTGSALVAAIQVEVFSRVTEDIQGLRILHSTGQLEAADQRVIGRMGALEQSLRRQQRLINVIGPFSSFLPIAAMALIAGMGLLVFGARSTGILPSLVTFVLALQRLNVRFAGIAENFNRLSDNAGRYQRLNDILSNDGKQFRRRGGVPFQALEQEIRLEDVSLRYQPDLPAAVEGVSFSLTRGKTVALVGASGAGKSSIADLLVGLYAPTAGQILVDGTDLETLNLASWQQRLGVVSQDTFLFNTSLANNIAFGTPHASQEQVVDAAVKAQAAGFIEALPDGYDTLVGERGFRLSGGQRQRISLARAILRDPELLILDEATSALDTQSERLVQEAIERFERQHTVLVIAHRLSTVVNADEILLMHNGRIVERGRHEELVAKGGRYRELWFQQSMPNSMTSAPGVGG
ncbi:ABC transporter ATP-binding protein [Synechococcus sp. ATX 2A4]|uniref:ABC transporter ATP-binding protein n=1 Tax=Synechococcus sp. ATX 2A4 TaxID=2823727 RepID=UPI0020CF77A3|nr:ABC transporter ATP-binding protein [Synechococcus sp. ATX 2A4]